MKCKYYNGSRKISTAFINGAQYFIKELSEEEVIAEVLASCIGEILGFNVVKNCQRNMDTIYSKHYDKSINDICVPTEHNINKIPTNQLYDMFIFDHLIINKDRHIGNIEILKDTITNKYRLAELYDFNISLLSDVSDNSLEVKQYNFNPTTQNYNNKSLLDNTLEVSSSDYTKYINIDKIIVSDISNKFTDEELADNYILSRIECILNIVNIRIQYLLELGILKLGDNISWTNI